jgi:hypothetical protein
LHRESPFRRLKLHRLLQVRQIMAATSRNRSIAGILAGNFRLNIRRASSRI